MSLAQPNLEQTLLARHHNEVERAARLRKLWEEVDIDKSGSISCAELEYVLNTNPILLHHFSIDGLDINDIGMFFKLLSQIKEPFDQLDIEDFIEGCMRMKGPATNMDLRAVSYQMKALHWHHERFTKQCLNELKGLRAESGARGNCART